MFSRSAPNRIENAGHQPCLVSSLLLLRFSFEFDVGCSCTSTKQKKPGHSTFSGRPGPSLCEVRGVRKEQARHAPRNGFSVSPVVLISQYSCLPPNLLTPNLLFLSAFSFGPDPLFQPEAQRSRRTIGCSLPMASMKDRRGSHSVCLSMDVSWWLHSSLNL